MKMEKKRIIIIYLTWDGEKRMRAAPEQRAPFKCRATNTLLVVGPPSDASPPIRQEKSMDERTHERAIFQKQ